MKCLVVVNPVFVLTHFSGLVIPEKEESDAVPEVTATSGAVFLHFYSDAAYNMSGFNITYK